MLVVPVALRPFEQRSPPSIEVLQCRLQAGSTVGDLKDCVESQLDKHYAVIQIKYMGARPLLSSALKSYTPDSSSTPRFVASYVAPIRVIVELPDGRGQVELSVR